MSIYIVAAVLSVPPSLAFCVVGVVAVRRANRKDIPAVVRALVRASPADERVPAIRQLTRSAGEHGSSRTATTRKRTITS